MRVWIEVVIIFNRKQKMQVSSQINRRVNNIYRFNKSKVFGYLRINENQCSWSLVMEGWGGYVGQVVMVQVLQDLKDMINI